MAQAPNSDIHRDQGMIWYWEAPAIWQQLLRRHFEQFKVSHVGSWIAGLLATPPAPEYSANGNGVAVFYPNLAWMGIAAAGQLQALRPVVLTSPADAVYHMMALTRQAGLLNSQTPWQCYGMLEVDSAIWQSIDDYMGMATMPQPLPQQALPHWYFGYLTGPCTFL